MPPPPAATARTLIHTNRPNNLSSPPPPNLTTACMVVSISPKFLNQEPGHTSFLCEELRPSSLLKLFSLLLYRFIVHHQNTTIILFNMQLENIRKKGLWFESVRMRRKAHRKKLHLSLDLRRLRVGLVFLRCTWCSIHTSFKMTEASLFLSCSSCTVKVIMFINF